MGNDIWIPRLVVVLLGMVSLAAVVAGTILAADKVELPPFISGLGTSAITTLGIVATVLYRPVGNGSSGSSPGKNVP